MTTTRATSDPPILPPKAALRLSEVDAAVSVIKHNFSPLSTAIGRNMTNCAHKFYCWKKLWYNIYFLLKDVTIIILKKISFTLMQI